MLASAVEAAQRAGQAIVERYPASHNLVFKGYRDIVTDADTAAEAIILDLIRARFPDHAIISEEAGGPQDEAGRKHPLDEGYTWIVDPLDGTTNYAHHVPVFSVSIGVLKDGEPLVGVVYDPLRKHTFVAQRGEGARLDGERINVSRGSRLDRAVVGLDWGHSDEVREQVLDRLQPVAMRCGTVRALGSAALALAYVAAGRLDAYFNLALKPWDTAAGALLVIEAGGRCTTLEGGPYRVGSPGCLATNGRVHAGLLAVIEEP